MIKKLCARNRRLCVALLLAAWLPPACRAAVPPHDAAGPVDCAALTEHLSHPRWLSLPGSRLVVNPFYGPYSGALDTSGAPDGVLPMNLAYYVGAAPVRLPGFWFLQNTPVAGQGIVVGPRLDLAPASAADWRADGVVPTFVGGGVRLTTTDQNFGALTRTVTVDLDRTPDLLADVPSGRANWAIKVNSRNQPVDVALAPARRLGAQVADVVAATGWHGTRTFQVRLFEVGRGQSITFSRVQFFRLPAAVLAPAVEGNTWSPAEILSRARAGVAVGDVQSAVTMPDDASVAQRLHIGPGGPSALTLTGQFAGDVHWDPARNTLLLRGAGFRAVLTVSRRARWLGLRPTLLDWALGEGASSGTMSGVWRLALTGLHSGDDIVVIARFAPSAGRLRDVRGAAQMQTTPTQFAAAVVRNEAAWNRRLALVPRPRDFMPRAVPSRGVTASAVRCSYYRAWVFFDDDTLPPMPENGFPYPQVCTGKPSLWTDGGTHTEETALWDSSAAMQALALIEPHVVWAAAQGIMAQVDSEGYLNGEALPTIFARTLWLLYQQTGDRDKLRSLYPALKRFLVWKIDNPRWVYPNRTKPAANPNADKDQEFVCHEIVDMGYAVQIAEALRRPDERAFWRQEQQRAMADYRRWFWPTPGGRVYRIYASNTDRGDPDDPWSLQGLQIDPSLLPAADSAALAALFHRTMNPGLPFLVPGRTRFGDLAPITLGLFRHGQPTEAARLADACLRDVTRAGEFSEDYTQIDPPVPNGVRPSSFGARLMMDSVFWHNGVVLDQGFPVLLGMPGAAGVDNIPVQGKALSVQFHGAAHTVTLCGPALARLGRPVGFRASRAPGGEVCWTGSIAEGQQIRLEAGRRLSESK